MKKVMLFALMGMFSVAMFAQAQEKAKPVEKKKEPAKTEATTHVAKEAKPMTKEVAKHSKHSAKETAKPAETTPKK